MEIVGKQAMKMVRPTLFGCHEEEVRRRLLDEGSNEEPNLEEEEVRKMYGQIGLGGFRGTDGSVRTGAKPVGWKLPR